MPRRAIIIVHGVGDSKPGDMIRAVADPLVGVVPGLRFDSHMHQILLKEYDHKTRARRGFEVMTRDGTDGTETWQLAEMHWADVTRAKQETHSFLLSVGHFLYGLRHIGEQSRLIPGFLAATLALFMRILAVILLGPISALIVFETLLCLIYFMFIPRPWDNLPTGPVIAHVLQGIVAVVVIAGLASTGNWKSGNITVRSLLWVAVGALLHAVIISNEVGRTLHDKHILPQLNIVKHNGAHDIPAAWMLIVYMIDKILDLLGIVISACLILSGITIFVAWFSVSQKSLFRGLWTSWVATVIMLAGWVAAAIPLNLLVQHAYDRDAWAIDSNPQYTLWYDVARVTLLGICGMLCGIWEAMGLTEWATKYRAVPPAAAPAAPRLIVASTILACVVVFAIAYGPLAILDGLAWIDGRDGKLPYGVVNAVLIVAALVYFKWSVVSRNIIHILNDVVVHFARRDGFELLASPDSVRRYTIRRRLAWRFRSVLKFVLRSNPDELIIVAHSQGTIIVLEELLKQRSLSFLGGGGVKLVTLGSPLTHLYQYYFPSLYRPLGKRQWKRLRLHLPVWFNFYRIDDYVGTHITGANPHWPRNVPLRPAGMMMGHTSYWKRSIIRRVVRVMYPPPPPSLPVEVLYALNL